MNDKLVEELKIAIEELNIDKRKKENTIFIDRRISNKKWYYN